MNTCPECNNNLSTELLEDIEIDKCSTCNGIWLDANELQQIAKRTPDRSTHTTNSSPSTLATRDIDITIDNDTIKQHTKNKKRKCPKCSDNELISFIFGGDSNIELDRCPKCEGIWFDEGELNKIISLIIKNNNIAISDQDDKYSETNKPLYLKIITAILKAVSSNPYNHGIH
jgi:Zn-finger nucleic acid-binding protein